MTRSARHARRAIALALVWLAWLAVQPARSDVTTFPGASWEHVSPAGANGWSSEGLADARAYAATIDTAAVMIVEGGRVVDEWGETSRRFNVHSIRKSMLSALYGIYVAESAIDLDVTMASLGIDDNAPSLTDLEKTATVRQLLQARSGVYHPALYETDGMKAARPARGSHAPGTFWYYNNWDFNVLGTVFERLTKTNLFRAFGERLAAPLGMEDWRLEDGAYVTGPDSVYPAYPFRLTARDMARLGLLYLRGGRWNGKQILPEAWVAESTASYSDAGRSGGYGYLWWVTVDGRHLPGVTLPAGTYSARGAGGHYILVVPPLDLVIVHRVNTDERGRQVTGEQFGELVRRLLAARSAGTGAGR